MKINEKLDHISEDILTIHPILLKKLMLFEDHHSDLVKQKTNFKILWVLETCGKTPISEIGKRLCISKPNMTVLMDNLIAQGLVIRASDKKDKRIINIELSEKGKKFLEDSRKQIKNLIKNNLLVLNDKEILLLHDSLENIKFILEKITEKK